MLHQLSYPRTKQSKTGAKDGIRTHNQRNTKPLFYHLNYFGIKKWSEQQDFNLRFHGPKPCRLNKLSYARFILVEAPGTAPGSSVCKTVMLPLITTPPVYQVSIHSKSSGVFTASLPLSYSWIKYLVPLGIAAILRLAPAPPAPMLPSSSTT